MVPLSDTLVASIPQGVIVQDGNEALLIPSRRRPSSVTTTRSTTTASRSGLLDSRIPSTPSTLHRALNAGLGDAGVVCLHAYGDPLSQAILDRA